MGRRIPLLTLGILLAFPPTVLCLWTVVRAVDNAAVTGGAPPLRPACANAILPWNIAPLSLSIDTSRVSIAIATWQGVRGGQVVALSLGGPLRARTSAWRRMLEQNRGSEVRCRVTLRRAGRWLRYGEFTNAVSPDAIDRYVTYRLIGCAHHMWRDMGLYERDLESFAERALVRNAAVGRACLSCHTTQANRPDRALIHVRDMKRGPSMLALSGPRVAAMDTRSRHNPAPASYASIHPTRPLAAFAALSLSQYMMDAGELREVFEWAGDIAVLNMESGAIFGAPQLATREYVETDPAWAADGRALFFSRTPVRWASTDADRPPLPEGYRDTRYALVRIDYNPDEYTWGSAEEVLSSDLEQASLVRPAPSPDGRFLAYCRTDHGNFPIFRPTSDIGLVELENGRRRTPAFNSERADSNPVWSSNSRWILFTSKRNDGVFTRLYIAHVTADGTTAPAIELPQRDPDAMDRRLVAFNTPQLLITPFQATSADLVAAIERSAAGPIVHATTGATVPQHRQPSNPVATAALTPGDG